MPAFAGTTLCSGNSYSVCTGAGYTDHGYAANSGNSYWGMDTGHNCTNYVAYVEQAVNGVPAPNYLLGNADQWYSNASANGVITNGTPAKGSVAWWGDAAWNGSQGHVAYVESVNSDNSITVSEDAYPSGPFDWMTIPQGDPHWPGGFIHFKDLSGSSGSGFQMILDPGGNVWARNGVGYNWTEEVVGGMTEIAAGGGTQMALDEGGNVWAESSSSPANSWTEEVSGNGNIQAIAAGDGGFQMILDPGGNVWAKNSIGAGGWTEEIAGGMKAISAGGGTQMVLDDAGNVWAKSTSSIASGGWTEEVSGNGNIQAIAAGDGGFQMILDPGGNVWAKNSIGAGGWTEEIAGGMKAISAGGGTQMVLDDAGNVWAKSTSSIASGGWTEEVGGNANMQAIAAGASGLQIILDPGGNVWAENSIGNSWTEEVSGNGSMQAIAAG